MTESGGLYFLLVIVVGIAASMRGRSGLGWGTVALVITPLLAGLILLWLPRLQPQPAGASQAIHQSNAVPVMMVTAGCIVCALLVIGLLADPKPTETTAAPQPANTTAQPVTAAEWQAYLRAQQQLPPKTEDKPPALTAEEKAKAEFNRKAVVECDLADDLLGRKARSIEEKFMRDAKCVERAERYQRKTHGYRDPAWRERAATMPGAELFNPSCAGLSAAACDRRKYELGKRLGLWD